MVCSRHIGPAGLQEFMRTGVQRVSFDAGEDTISKTLAREAAVAVWAATDFPV